MYIRIRKVIFILMRNQSIPLSDFLYTVAFYLLYGVSIFIARQAKSKHIYSNIRPISADKTSHDCETEISPRWSTSSVSKRNRRVATAGGRPGRFTVHRRNPVSICNQVNLTIATDGFHDDSIQWLAGSGGWQRGAFPVTRWMEISSFIAGLGAGGEIVLASRRLRFEFRVGGGIYFSCIDCPRAEMHPMTWRRASRRPVDA